MQQQQSQQHNLFIAVIPTSLEERYRHCAWCWHKKFPGVSYPREWSSTLCPICEAEEYSKIEARQARKAASLEAKS